MLDTVMPQTRTWSRLIPCETCDWYEHGLSRYSNFSNLSKVQVKNTSLPISYLASYLNHIRFHIMYLYICTHLDRFREAGPSLLPFVYFMYESGRLIGILLLSGLLLWPLCRASGVLSLTNFTVLIVILHDNLIFISKSLIHLLCACRHYKKKGMTFWPNCYQF